MRERFLISAVALVAVSWVLGLLSPMAALVGPFIAGYVFARYKIGVARPNPLSGALGSGTAVAIMITPILLMAWLLLTATGDPGEAETLFGALFDGQAQSGRVTASLLVAGAAVGLGAAGGALAVWQHRRRLSREYWVTEED